jgi:hypothetical protein
MFAAGYVMHLPSCAHNMDQNWAGFLRRAYHAYKNFQGYFWVMCNGHPCSFQITRAAAARWKAIMSPRQTGYSRANTTNSDVPSINGQTVRSLEAFFGAGAATSSNGSASSCDMVVSSTPEAILAGGTRQILFYSLIFKSSSVCKGCPSSKVYDGVLSLGSAVTLCSTSHQHEMPVGNGISYNFNFVSAFFMWILGPFRDAEPVQERDLLTAVAR